MVKARTLRRGVLAIVAAVFMVLVGGLPVDDGGMAWEYYATGDMGMEWSMSSGTACLVQAAYYAWTGWGAVIGGAACMATGWA